MMAAIFAAAMWPMLAPPELATPALQNWTAPKRGRIYSMPAELEAIGSLQTAIKRLFPAGRYEAIKGRYSYPSVFETDTKWNMDLFSYERDHAEAAGPNIGLQGFNEPPPEPLFKEAVARSRAGGYIIGGFTSLLDNVWVVDGLLNSSSPDIRVRYGNSCENCKTHGKNGNLEHSQIEKVLAQYDADEREARFTGKPLTLSGRIYKGWDASVHVAKDEFMPPDGQKVFMVVDPAIAKPFAVIWGWMAADGIMRIYDESPSDIAFEGAKDSNQTVADYVSEFKRREEGRVVADRILDAHFGNARRTTGGRSLKEEFSEAGLEFRDSYTGPEEIETGILKVKGLLSWNKEKPQDSINCPRILISPKCRNTIASFARWGRNPTTGKPQESYKDFADVVRYAAMTIEHYEPREWGAASPAFYTVRS